MQMNFENGKLVITETLNTDATYILGSHESYLDIYKYAGQGCNWVLKPVPILLSRAIRNKWSIAINTEGKSIIISDETVVSVRQIVSKHKTVSKELELLRWHNDFIVIKDHWHHVSFYLDDVKSISIRPVIGIDELDKLDVVPEITITPDRTNGEVKWNVKATAKNPQLLEVFINDIRKILNYYTFQEGVKEQIIELFSNAAHNQVRNIQDTSLYVVKSLEELASLFLIKGFQQRGFYGRNNIENFNKLRNGEKTIVNISENRFNFVEIDFIELALKD